MKSRYCNSYAPNQRDELLIGILNVADLGQFAFNFSAYRRDESRNTIENALSCPSVGQRPVANSKPQSNECHHDISD